MKKEMIVRAWKDPEFRASLTAEQRAELPESPSGRPMNELEETDLGSAVGGVPRTCFSCNDLSFDFNRCSVSIAIHCRTYRPLCPDPGPNPLM